MTEKILTLEEFQKLHNAFNHECSKLINAVIARDATISALAKENEELKKYKQNDAEIAEWKAKAAKYDVIAGALGGV